MAFLPCIGTQSPPRRRDPSPLSRGRRHHRLGIRSIAVEAPGKRGAWLPCCAIGASPSIGEGDAVYGERHDYFGEGQLGLFLPGDRRRPNRRHCDPVPAGYLGSSLPSSV